MGQLTHLKKLTKRRNEMTPAEKEIILKFLNEIKSELKIDILSKEPEFFIRWKREKVDNIEWMIEKVKEMK